MKKKSILVNRTQAQRGYIVFLSMTLNVIGTNVTDMQHIECVARFGAQLLKPNVNKHLSNEDTLKTIQLLEVLESYVNKIESL